LSAPCSGTASTRRDTGRQKCVFIEDPALLKRVREHGVVVVAVVKAADPMLEIEWGSRFVRLQFGNAYTP
jgi:hypothetical protein